MTTKLDKLHKALQEQLSDDTAQKIFDVLSGAAFEAFEKGDFTDHSLGEEDAPSKDEILARIKELFRGLA